MPIRAKGSAGISDHGGLTGLADDDHTQYILVDGSRAFTGAISLGANRIADVGAIDMPSGTSDPISPVDGDVYFNTNDTTIRRYNGSTWDVYSSSGTDHGGLTGLTDDDHTQYILVDGTRAFTGDTDFGGQAITNVGTFTFPSAASNPGSPTSGDVYWNTAQNTFYRFNGSTWDAHDAGATDHGALTGKGDDDHTQYVLADGTRAFTGDFSGGGNRLSSLGALAFPHSAADPGSPTEDDVYWNTTSDVLRRYNGSTWDEISGGGGGSDHGGLTGLADDDHTQYILVDGTRAFTGDVALGSNRLSGISTIEFPSAASNPGSPTTGDIYWDTTDTTFYRYNGSTWEAVAIGGDVTGSLAAAVVEKIRGTNVDPTAPNDTEVLQYSSGSAAYVPSVQAASKVAFTPAGTIAATDVQAAIEEVASEAGSGDPTMGGDVTGTASAATVAAIRGHAVTASTPTLGQILQSSGSSWVLQSPGGDVSGRIDFLQVDALRGRTIETGTPIVGEVMEWDGANWAYAANGGGVTDHGALTGLTDDDHVRYFDKDGSKSMTGDLDMDSNDIVNVGGIELPSAASSGAFPSAATHAGNVYVLYDSTGNDQYALYFSNGTSWERLTHNMNDQGRVTGNIHFWDDEGRMTLPQWSTVPGSPLDDGEIVYNKTSDTVQFYDLGAAAWRTVVTTDTAVDTNTQTVTYCVPFYIATGETDQNFYGPRAVSSTSNNVNLWDQSYGDDTDNPDVSSVDYADASGFFLPSGGTILDVAFSVQSDSASDIDYLFNAIIIGPNYSNNRATTEALVDSSAVTETLADDFKLVQLQVDTTTVDAGDIIVPVIGKNENTASNIYGHVTITVRL